MDTLKIADRLKKAPLEKYFGVSSLDEMDWFQLTRPQFKEVVQLVNENKEWSENEIEDFLRILSDEDFLDFLRPQIEEQGFHPISSERFELLTGEKQSIKKNAAVFVHSKSLLKYRIRFNERYEWLLQAMAIDYARAISEPILDTYKEEFEGNERVLEEIALQWAYEKENMRWVFEGKTNSLHGYLKGKKISNWSNGEAVNQFQDAVR
ncbi:MAG TPA: hypothetical protein DHN33_10920 [Eubacteriaceae bacterium]|nr:hypothetical protein [Eubacteriaceae bacterium]